MITDEPRRPLWLLIIPLLACPLIAICALIGVGAAATDTPLSLILMDSTYIPHFIMKKFPFFGMKCGM